MSVRLLRYGTTFAWHSNSIMRDLAVARIFFDICLVAIAWLPVVLLKTLATPTQRGFFCNDETIRYPYYPSTIDPIVLYTVGYGLPIFLILSVEAYRTYRGDRIIRGCPVDAAHSVLKRPVPTYLSRVYLYVGYFLLGGAFNQVITNVGKYTIGRLRPHFIDICKPDWSEITKECAEGVYVRDFQCTGPNVYRIDDARLSFPSGHASVAFYTMMFSVLYLEARGGYFGSRIFRPVIQLLLLSLALFTALSRVSDYKHHPFDVLTGCLLGTVIALVLGLRVLKIFEPLPWLLPKWNPAPDSEFDDAVGYFSPSSRRTTSTPV